MARYDYVVMTEGFHINGVARARGERLSGEDADWLEREESLGHHHHVVRVTKAESSPAAPAAVAARAPEPEAAPHDALDDESEHEPHELGEGHA